MPIIGLSFRKMEARREKGQIKGEIKVDSAPDIKGLTETLIPTLNKKAIVMEFDFVTKYHPPIGEIKMSGELVYMAEKNATILSHWKKNKKLPDDVSVEVLNHLFRRCLLKMANIAEDLQLPPPISLPVARIQPKE